MRRARSCATVWGLFLAEMGRGSRVRFGAVIVRPKHVHLGRGCFIARGVRLTAAKGSGDLVLGDDVTVLAHAVLDHTGGLVIEDGAWISREAFIMTHDHARDPRSYPTRASLRIGRKAWIGLRAIVMPQVREIGEGAVIGAGAVLTRDAPAHSVMAGNPARVISDTRTQRPMAKAGAAQ
jgi:acetyltransferase-like isoleucine patch superfamily enzyme